MKKQSFFHLTNNYSFWVPFGNTCWSGVLWALSERVGSYIRHDVLPTHSTPAPSPCEHQESTESIILQCRRRRYSSLWRDSYSAISIIRYTVKRRRKKASIFANNQATHHLLLHLHYNCSIQVPSWAFYTFAYSVSYCSSAHLHPYSQWSRPITTTQTTSLRIIATYESQDLSNEAN